MIAVVRKLSLVGGALALSLPFIAFAQSPVAEERASANASFRNDRSQVPLRDVPDRPVTGPARGGRDFEPGRPEPVGNTNPAGADPLEARGAGASRATAVPLLASIDGVPVDPNRRVAPPDTTGDMSPTHYVQWVNSRYSIYTLTRDASNQITQFNLVSGFPKNGNTIWAGFGGVCETTNDGDPIVQYDQFAQRWVLTQFAVSSAPYTQCVAVSTTSDPTGTYYRYAFQYGSFFNDFPKMAVWGNAYVITYNMFRNGSRFAGADVCAMDRARMLNGLPATQICARTNQGASLLPADVDGLTAPPNPSTVPLLSISSTALASWRFTFNFTNGTGTLTGPVAVSGASTFTRACSGGTCIPQPGTTRTLDSLADRLNYRLAYRNFGTHESMVVNHAVAASGTSAIRWYELRNAANQTLSSAAPVVRQQGTYRPDAVYRWMGSAAIDKTGGIAVAYNVSDASSVKPGIRYTFRGPNDTLGTLSAAEVNVLTGPAVQTGTLSRWGDYSTLSIDPIDGCTMVFTTEYIPTNGSFNWSTYIHSFKLSSCQ